MHKERDRRSREGKKSAWQRQGDEKKGKQKNKSNQSSLDRRFKKADKKVEQQKSDSLKMQVSRIQVGGETAPWSTT